MTSKGCNECPGSVSDVRLTRRLKRRYIAEPNLKCNLLSSARNKIACNVNQRGDSGIDSDYAIFLNAGILAHRSVPSSDKDEDEVDSDLDCLPADLEDPQYKLFFENLKEDGNSYVLEVAASGGVTYTIKYEKEVEERYDLDRQEMETIDRNAVTRDNVWVNSKGGKTVTPKISKKVADEEKRISEVGKSRRLKPGNPVFGVINKSSSKKRSMKAPNLSEQESSTETDENYLRFLSYVRMKGETLILTSDTGKQVIYEEDEESSSDSDLIMMDTDPYHRQNNTPFIDLVNGSGTGNNSKFRAELMNLLQRPYNQKEYDDRWQAVSRRKGRDKSFLKHHASLKEKINLVKRDRCKILNLLRGFFYWLEHVADEGSFPPWLDPSCLEVLPGKVDSSGSK